MARTRLQSAPIVEQKTLNNQSKYSTQSSSKRAILLKMYEMERQAILNEYLRCRNQIIEKSINHSNRGRSVEDNLISTDTKSSEQFSIFIDCLPESNSYCTQSEQKMDESNYQQPVEQHLEIELPLQNEVSGSNENVRSQQSTASTNNLEIGLLCRSQINDKVNLEAIQISRSNSVKRSQHRYGSIKYRSEASKRLQRKSKLIERSITKFGLESFKDRYKYTFKLSRHWKVVVWTIRCCNGTMIANVGFSFPVIIPRHYQIIFRRNSRNGHRILTIAQAPEFTLEERSCNGHKVRLALGIFNHGLVKQNNCFNYSVNGGKC